MLPISLAPPLATLPFALEHKAYPQSISQDAPLLALPSSDPKEFGEMQDLKIVIKNFANKVIVIERQNSKRKFEGYQQRRLPYITKDQAASTSNVALRTNTMIHTT